VHSVLRTNLARKYAWQPTNSYTMPKHATNQARLDSETSVEQGSSCLGSSCLRASLKPRACATPTWGSPLFERTDDNTRRAAVVGFKVSPSWLLILAFFLNGNLEGHELLFLKDQGMFRHVFNAGGVLGGLPAFTKSPILGKEVARNPCQLGVLPPRVQQLKRNRTNSPRLMRPSQGVCPQNSSTCPRWLLGPRKSFHSLPLRRLSTSRVCYRCRA